MGTILITGASGFIGKNLLRHISERHSDYKNNILLLSSSHLDDFPAILHNDYNFSGKDFETIGCTDIDIVIHAGAFTPKSGNDANLHRENFSNVLNTYHLLHNLPNKPAKFIFISTLDVYEKTVGLISENTPTSPATFYGQCKLYCEQLVLNWCAENDVVPQILRLGHIYGNGEQAYKKLIPETIRTILADERPVIFTDGSERRSFLHVDDCVKAIWQSTNLSEYIGPINITSSIALSVKQIIQTIIDVSGKNIDVDILNKDIESRDMIFDNQKMCTHLSDENVDIATGLAQEYETFLIASKVTS